MKQLGLQKYFTTHQIFIISIVFKGLNGLLEIAGGLLALFVSKQTAVHITGFLVKNELLEDPSDIVANFLVHTVGSYTSTAHLFVTLYLLTHGILKVFLVYNLFKHKTWAYPLAIAVFGIFVVSQMIVYVKTPHPSLLFLTVLDVVIILLTWLEYTHIKKGYNTNLTISS